MAMTTVLVVAAVAMARFRLGPVRWAGDALARRRRTEARAEALLRWLSPRQREQHRSHGWFEVVTPGGNRYLTGVGEGDRLAGFAVRGPRTTT